MQAFTAPLDSGVSITIDQFTVTATIRHDDHSDAPWDAEDGHGPVSKLRKNRQKRGGELILTHDYGSARFYDFAAACKLALRDGWGAKPYRLHIEHGANGLTRASVQWFKGRDLCSHVTNWHDDINDSYRAGYAAHRASFPSARAYAAAAARADYDRLRAWCNDEWCYVGIVVTVTDTATGITLGDASLWGIESDDPSLHDHANELTHEALSNARNAIASLVNAASVTE